jgi:uncharacterized protein
MRRPFVYLDVANVAASADQRAIVLLTIDGVWLATRDCADDIRKEGFPPLREIMDSLVANDGEIWACGACTRPRGITEADLIPGARIVTGAMVVEAMANGAATLCF